MHINKLSMLHFALTSTLVLTSIIATAETIRPEGLSSLQEPRLVESNDTRAQRLLITDRTDTTVVDTNNTLPRIENAYSPNSYDGYMADLVAERQLFPEKNTYFDESTDADFSESKKYLKINKIIRGVIESEAGEEEYERAYCAFIEMSSGCIVKQETGSFCGGTWAETENTWIWASEELAIDERDPHKALSESDIEMLSEVGGAENVSRCVKHNS